MFQRNKGYLQDKILTNITTQIRLFSERERVKGERKKRESKRLLAKN